MELKKLMTSGNEWKWANLLCPPMNPLLVTSTYYTTSHVLRQAATTIVLLVGGGNGNNDGDEKGGIQRRGGRCKCQSEAVLSMCQDTAILSSVLQAQLLTLGTWPLAHETFILPNIQQNNILTRNMS